MAGPNIILKASSPGSYFSWAPDPCIQQLTRQLPISVPQDMEAPHVQNWTSSPPKVSSHPVFPIFWSLFTLLKTENWGSDMAPPSPSHCTCGQSLSLVHSTSCTSLEWGHISLFPLLPSCFSYLALCFQGGLWPVSLHIPAREMSTKYKFV